MADWNYLCREAILRSLCRWKECRAQLAGRRFHCLALAGAVPDAVFVNCDMTVSCNCQDFDATGRLGDLRRQSFEEVFAGAIATEFRRSLAAGKLPISRCGACWHLRTCAPSEADALAQGWRLPKGLGVENTVVCNLRCRSCCREEVMRHRGGRVRLSLDDVTRVAETLSHLGAEYCGYYNLGEPFLSPTICEELRILRQLNPTMRLFTSTNGLALDTDAKREAALLLDEMVISLDGVDTAMVRRYQRGGDFDRAYENLRAMAAYRDARGRRRPTILWKYVLFRWNDAPATVRRAIALAEAAGVDGLQLTSSRTPLRGVSWRFHLSPFYRRLAPRQGRFRHVWLTRAPRGAPDEPG